MSETQTPSQAASREAYRIAYDFQAANPTGSPVLAWPGTRDDEPLRTRTRLSAWVLASGEPVVTVRGHAGAIALTHVDPDPTRQPAVPDVEFTCPPCPICGRELASDGDALVCHKCEASWSSNGTGGTWADPDAPRCLAKRTIGDDVDQCILARDHDVDAETSHRDADGFDWLDSDRRALTDTLGEEL